MSTVEKTTLHIQQLPQPFRREALNFVEFLLAMNVAGENGKAISWQVLQPD